MKQLRKVEKVLKARGLDDIHNYLIKNKISSIDDIQEVFKDSKTRVEIMLDIGALEHLGLIMIKLGNPIRFIAINEEDYLIRYEKIFSNQEEKELLKQKAKVEKMQELRQRLLNKGDTVGVIMINTIIRLEKEQNE